MREMFHTWGGGGWRRAWGGVERKLAVEEKHVSKDRVEVCSCPDATISSLFTPKWGKGGDGQSKHVPRKGCAGLVLVRCTPASVQSFSSKTFYS